MLSVIWLETHLRHTHTQTHTRTHARTHTHTRTRTHTRTNTRTHTEITTLECDGQILNRHWFGTLPARLN